MKKETKTQKRWAAFAKHYAISRNATEAALAAGYGKGNRPSAGETGYRLLKRPEVDAMWRALATETTLARVERGEVTTDSVLDELFDVIAMCKQAGAGAWQAANRIKAAELIGKHLKMWTEKLEVGADDELMRILQEGRKRAAQLSSMEQDAMRGGVPCQAKPN